jgi:hypothetical protein
MPQVVEWLAASVTVVVSLFMGDATPYVRL